MSWRDLTNEEMKIEIRAQGQAYAPGSPGWEAFGMRWDKAEVDGVPYGLLPGEVMTATYRDPMPLADYAALLQARDVNDYAEHERQEQVRVQAAAALELEQATAGLRGGA